MCARGGQCGGCFALATVTALEALYAIHGMGYCPLSAQQLVECSGNNGKSNRPSPSSGP